MKDFPNLKVLEIPAAGDPVLLAALEQPALPQPRCEGYLHACRRRVPRPRCRRCAARACCFPAGDAKHRGGQQRRHRTGIRRHPQGEIGTTISQPADLYAKYGLYYIKATLAGQTFKVGPTDHGEAPSSRSRRASWKTSFRRPW